MIEEMYIASAAAVRSKVGVVATALESNVTALLGSRTSHRHAQPPQRHASYE